MRHPSPPGKVLEGEVASSFCPFQSLHALWAAHLDERHTLFNLKSHGVGCAMMLCCDQGWHSMLHQHALPGMSARGSWIAQGPLRKKGRYDPVQIGRRTFLLLHCSTCPEDRCRGVGVLYHETLPLDKRHRTPCCGVWTDIMQGPCTPWEWEK